MFYTQFLKLCKEKGVAPTVVAESIGLNRSSASGWKRGSKPNSITLLSLAEYFGVDISYFDEDENKKTPPTDVRDGLEMLAEDEKILLQSYRSMTKGQQYAMQVWAREFKQGSN